MRGFEISECGKFAIYPDGTHQRLYKPDGDTLADFMEDAHSRVKIIQGPVGSGTSSACCVHILQQASAQPVQSDGKKRFRAYVIRETYGKLEETTIKTWQHWCPPSDSQGRGGFGRFYETRPYFHEVRFGDLELDVHFVALEDISDAVAFCRSLEPSLVWVNEGQFQPFKIIKELARRVSPPRFPAKIDGGCAWGGLIIDTNAPPADHWIPIMRGDVPPPDWMSEDDRQSLVKPYNWTFYLQPPGLIEVYENGVLMGYKPNPDAENLMWLPDNFYMEKVGASTKAEIDADIMNRSSVVVDGKPVYPNFMRDQHVSSKNLEAIPNLPLIIGLDFGRTPAALIMQSLRGDWFALREFIGRDIAADDFAPRLKNFLAQNFPDHSSREDGMLFWGDPAGDTRGQNFDTTPFDIFLKHGMKVKPAPNPQNAFSVRNEAMNAVLMRRSSSGQRAALLVDPRCVTFITGMAGGYYYRRVQVKGDIYKDEPEKRSQYSHVCEAGENAIVGGGEGRAVIMGGRTSKPVRYASGSRGVRRRVA